MPLIAEEEPVELFVVPPFDELAELPAHEQELFARMRHIISVQSAQACELLPEVAGLLVDHGALAVDYLIVGEGQYVVLAEGVHHGEGDLLVVVLPVDRVQADIGQDIVHPAHVPFEGEPQAAVGDGVRDPREGGGFLGYGNRAGAFPVNGLIQVLQEADRVQVLMSAVLVGDPLSALLAEVQVQHAADRVEAQAVGVVFPEPEQGVGLEEADRLAPGVVEQQRSPLRHFRAAGISVLVAGGAVELAQPRLVLGEMGGDPVQDYPDARLVQFIDEVPELVGRAVAGGRGVVADDLVAPGAVEGMFHYRHELHVRVAHFLQIGDQLAGNLGVVQDAPVLSPAPGAQVHLVDVHGLALRHLFLPGFHPFAVVPPVFRQVPQLAAVARAQLHLKAVGIGPHMPFPVGAEDRVFIGAEQLRGFGIAVFFRVALWPEQRVRQPQLPDAVILLFHGICFHVPAAELAHEGNALRVGCPDGEMPFQLPVFVHGMRAKEIIRVHTVPHVKAFTPLTVRRIVPHIARPPFSFFVCKNDYTISGVKSIRSGLFFQSGTSNRSITVPVRYSAFSAASFA